ncbi:hypothetical protein YASMINEVIRUS_1149 [Yasminevirus sp. GU-2018]|uniref:Uncharacterized protein n=1 Tax=Yasminevirus sp. GU-2018 TaxID=2420051 RepID=A0A5K0U9K0_9VIRU|nr:hypothetical protein YASMINEVIRUS_1149 [Yasminevirus sp. GU-2018]
MSDSIQKFAQATAQIKLSASNLESKDTFSKSDPFIAVFMRNRANVDSKFTEIGRTEKLKNNANPDFATLISFAYNLQDMQELRFDIFDSDSDSSDLSKHDLVHSETITVADFLKRGQGVATFTWTRKGGKKQSSMTARYERGTNNNDSIKMTVSCKDLPKMDVFGKIDPFFVIKRLAEDGKTWLECFKSPVIKSNYTPVWEIDQSVRTLCNGGVKAPVRIELYDWDSDGKNEFVGEAEVTFADLVKYRDTVDIPLVDKTNPKKPKNHGTISFTNVVMTRIKGFMDLVKEGLEINVNMAVDFTGSNGDPQSSDSLHYVHTTENQYQESIRRIGEAVIEYDTDRDIPLYGFGGQPRGARDVLHCFKLETVGSRSGVEKALDAYSNAIKRVELSGPTLFQEVIENTMALARSDLRKKRYHVLTIMTDGVINDMQKVKDLIVEASSLPMSIIIIGVGNADFSNMNELDADNGPLTDTRGFKAQRDIVQFVALNEVRRKGAATLGQMTLAELPSQIEQYYRKFEQDTF